MSKKSGYLTLNNPRFSINRDLWIICFQILIFLMVIWHRQKCAFIWSIYINLQNVFRNPAKNCLFANFAILKSVYMEKLYINLHRWNLLHRRTQKIEPCSWVIYKTLNNANPQATQQTSIQKLTNSFIFSNRKQT